jgi:hypothetical chaperone protein
MRIPFCGLDFGTSNSTVGIIDAGKPRLVPVEDTKVTIPSAIFFSFEDDQTYFGRKAIGEYIDGAEGRLMRALKSVLGTALMNDSTRIKSRSMSFIDIMGTFIAHLKAQAEHEMGEDIPNVVMGRPVQFVDDNPEADAEAQGQLEKAVKAQGFKHITFQFEPIAAALDYEQQVGEEQLALIVDIGGGTSDFSIVRVSPERAKTVDRRDDILANMGVHVGGTDFDRMLSMAKIMPHLGYRTPLRSGLDTPSSYYFDLATWQRINWLYNKKTLIDLRHVRYEAQHPELINRFISIIESRQGHNLASKVEEAKILLTQEHSATIDLSKVINQLSVTITREELNAAIERGVERIVTTVQNTLDQAALKAADIQALFLTGGSTQIPIIKDSIVKMFPGVKVIEGDMFGSVGLGLALDAKRKFG